MKKHFYLPFLAIILTSCHQTPPCCDEVLTENYIHRYGVPLTAEEWEARGRNGQIVSKQKDGVVATRSYEAGSLHGDCTFSFPHRERIQRKEVYDRGILKQQVHYHSTGLPQQQHTFQEDGKREVVSWYENGVPQSKEVYQEANLENGEYYTPDNQVESSVEDGNGLKTKRNGLGMLDSVDLIENGRLATRTTYHSNGTPAAISPYSNDKIHGLRRTFHPSGEPATLEEWEEDSQHGLTVVYENGEKLSEINYVKGEKHGIERRFWEGQSVAQEVTWEKGKKQGPCYSYVGNERKTDWYYANQLVNKPTYDAMSNQYTAPLK
jgi:antitoxin component YwqK of YwqJK toxin-antitoxin module